MYFFKQWGKIVRFVTCSNSYQQETIAIKGVDFNAQSKAFQMGQGNATTTIQHCIKCNFAIELWSGQNFAKTSDELNYRCLKMPALSNRWRQKTQGQLSPPTICLAAKKWTTQKTTKAWIVEGAGDGFEFLLALLVQNGIPCTYSKLCWSWKGLEIPLALSLFFKNTV